MWPGIVQAASEREVRDAERSALGYYLGSHPLRVERETLREEGIARLNLRLWQGERAEVACVVTRVMERKTKRGTYMGIVWAEDERSRRELVCFPRTWDMCGHDIERAERTGDVIVCEVSGGNDRLVLEAVRLLHPPDDTGPPIGDFLAVDLETTDDGTGDGVAVDVARQRIVEVGVALFSGGRCVSRNSRLINPGCNISDSSHAIHGITQAMVEREEPLGSRAPKLRELLKRYPIVTYNGRRFDLPVLRNELARVGFPMDGATMVDVDVFDHVRRHYAGQRGRPKSRKLADQLDFFKIAKGRSHRAADDAEATGKLLLRLIAEGYAPRSLELLKST